MKIHLFFYILCLLIIPVFANAQIDTVKINSIKQELKKAIEDTTRIRLTRNLSHEYFRRDERIYKQYLDETKRLIESTNEFVPDTPYMGTYTALSNYTLRYGQMDSTLYFAGLVEKRITTKTPADLKNIYWNLKSRIAAKQGNIEEELIYNYKIHDQVVLTGDKRNIAIAKLNLSQPLRKSKQYDKALQELQKALIAAKAVDFELIQGTILSNIAVIYNYLGFSDKFLKYNKESTAIHEKHQYDQRLLDNYTDYVNYYKQDGVDSLGLAKQYAEKALVVLERTPLPFPHLVVLSFLIDINIRLEDTPKIEQYIRQIREVKQQLPDSFLGISPYIAAEAQYASYNKQYNKAIEIYEDLLQNEYFTQNNISIGIHEALSDLYASKNNSTKVHYHLKKLSNLKDSLTQQTNIEQVAFLEAEKTNTENEKAIVILENEKALADAQTRQSRTAAAGVGALALLGFGFFWNARRQNKIIATQNKTLEGLNTTKDRIFAIIGHDLRKPALAFRGITEKVNYLLKNQDFERLNKLGVTMEREALSLNRLTDNLLNWALMQRDVLPHKPTNIQVKEIVDEVIELFTTTASNKDITLKSSVSPNLKVLADPDALQTIIRNLVDNAIKYTSENGVVEIEAISENNQVNINIKDNGIGMEQKQLKSIFVLQKDKSQRGTSGEKGTGLGLHLVEELVKINQGTIKAVSQLGQGTNIKIVLPVN